MSTLNVGDPESLLMVYVTSWPPLTLSGFVIAEDAGAVPFVPPSTDLLNPVTSETGEDTEAKASPDPEVMVVEIITKIFPSSVGV